MRSSIAPELGQHLRELHLIKVRTHQSHPGDDDMQYTTYHSSSSTSVNLNEKHGVLNNTPFAGQDYRKRFIIPYNGFIEENKHLTK
jgi:hypothetical protein